MALFTPPYQQFFHTPADRAVASGTKFITEIDPSLNSNSNLPDWPAANNKELSVSMWVWISQATFDAAPAAYSTNAELCNFIVSPGEVRVDMHDINGAKVPSSSFLAGPRIVFTPDQWNWMRFSVSHTVDLPFLTSEWGFPTRYLDTDVGNDIRYAEVQIWVGLALDFNNPVVEAAFMQVIRGEEYPADPVPVRATRNGPVVGWKPRGSVVFGRPDVAFYGFSRIDDLTPPFFWTNQGYIGVFNNIGSLETFGPGPAFIR